MDPGWRLLQIRHNKKARDKRTSGGDSRFWDWEAVIMFYDITIAVDGYAEMGAAPRRRAAERGAPLQGGTCRALQICAGSFAA